MTGALPSEEWRYLRVASGLVVLLVVAQLAGWIVYRSLHEPTTALQQTERCLRREKLLPIESIGNEPIANSARGGALATRVEGNGVHVVIAETDDEAASLGRAYLETSGRRIGLRLDVRGRVVYVWEQARPPTPTQRQTLYDCWYQ